MARSAGGRTMIAMAARSGCCRHMSLAVHQSDSRTAFDGNLGRKLIN